MNGAEKLLAELSKFASPNRKNLFKEAVFRDYRVRKFVEKYVRSDISQTDILAYLGATAGPAIVALAKGYRITDIAKAMNLRPSEIRKKLVDACYYASVFRFEKVENKVETK